MNDTSNSPHGDAPTDRPGMRPTDPVRETLSDILEFAGELNEYVLAPGEAAFLTHRQTQYVAEALLHRIGEAVSRLPGDFTTAHPEVQWQNMKGMRNVVAHEYGFVDYRIVWRALSRDLPEDVAAIRRILARRAGQ